MGNRIYEINENFFDCIDTEEKAYMLGFIFADGSNKENKRTITIGLSNIDKVILYKFRDIIFINKDKELYYRKDKAACELNIYNTHMSKQLATLGCIQNKTHVVEYPKCVSKDLEHHFIRGVFDGDGCISTTILKTGKQIGTKKTYFSITGNELFIKEINRVIALNCGINENKLIRRKDKKSVSCVFTGCRQCIKIREWLYKDATIYLDRKYEKFKKLGTTEWGTYGTQSKPSYKVLRPREKGKNLTVSKYCTVCSKLLKRTSQYIHNESIYCYNCYVRNGYKSKKRIDNNIKIENNTCIMKIKENTIIFDLEDIDTVDEYKWHIEKKYVMCTVRYPKRKTYYLQRIILNLDEPNKYIRFKNGNSFDCRKENLEVYSK